MFSDGVIIFCEKVNSATAGLKPVEKLRKVCEEFFEYRTVGVTRLYQASGASRQVDELVRVWDNPAVKVDMYAVMESGEQLRIDAVQRVFDDDGLRCLDVTLVRIDKLYELEEAEDESDS